MSPTLRNIPAVRARAEEQAREQHDALRARDRSLPTWDELPAWSASYALVRRDPDPCALRVDATRDLLCNLDRPASRDAIARLVADALGLDCGATAPNLYRDSHGAWHLVVDGRTVVFADAPPHHLRPGTEYRVVPGISAITDRAEALRRVALAVLGGPRG